MIVSALATLSVLSTLLFPLADVPLSDCRIGQLNCDWTKQGLYIGSTKAADALASDYPPGVKDKADPTSWYQYATIIACGKNHPEDPGEAACAAALNVCAVQDPGSPGPHHWIFRRTVLRDGGTGNWSQIGHTCFPEIVPSESGDLAQTLTDAMIEEQFHQTDFALPQAVIQPPDNRTLVNLPVYYQLAWPEEGFEPQEIDTTELAGSSVRIRPTLQDVTYLFGDGTSEGPTKSLGGRYPGGDITHSYVAKGSVSPSVSVTYGGEVSVDGGDWQTIPASVTIDGPAVPLEVFTSRNRLYQN